MCRQHFGSPSSRPTGTLRMRRANVQQDVAATPIGIQIKNSTVQQSRHAAISDVSVENSTMHPASAWSQTSKQAFRARCHIADLSGVGTSFRRDGFIQKLENYSRTERSLADGASTRLNPTPVERLRKSPVSSWLQAHIPQKVLRKACDQVETGDAQLTSLELSERKCTCELLRRKQLGVMFA